MPNLAPLSFDDTAIAFEYKRDAALKRAQLLFTSLQYNLLVKVGPTLAEFALRIGLPVKNLMMDYFFRQFCGGLSLEELAPTAKVLQEYGVRCILDYAVEGQKNERGFDATQAEFLRMVAYGKQHPDQVAFVAIKLSGLGSTAVMEKQQAGKPLSGAELRQLEKFRTRLEQLCTAAADAGQAIMIDAEESWFQDVVDGLAEDMMALHNRGRAIVYTTVQAYRHDRLAYLHRLNEKAKNQGFIAGIKLVRGAYLEKENQRAHKLNYTSPMQPSKARTDADYNEAARFCLAQLQQLCLCAGTHNEVSCKLLAEEMDSLGIDRQDPRVFFAQLYGMSDNISFNLAKAGYNVAKYLPYGPLEAVMPYLSRRAQENSAIAGQTGRELGLIQQELSQRKALQRNHRQLKPAATVAQQA